MRNCTKNYPMRWWVWTRMGQRGSHGRLLKKKVTVGGGPVSQAFCDRIGAEGYARNATEAVRLCQGLFK